MRLLHIILAYLTKIVRTAVLLIGCIPREVAQSVIMQWGGPHAEQNALSFADAVAGEDKFNASHTRKRNKRQKGLEITFDPVAHK